MPVLSGLKVVEFDALGPVPLCAMILADHGAELVRIVRPGTPVVDESVGGTILHRGRPLVTLDLKKAEDREAALDIVAEADAVVEGFRPGVMERLGLGPEACQARNPKLVYGRMTGWGQSGPLAERAGHDINYIALTGALAAIGPAEAPVPPLNVIGDYAGGTMFLAFGILAGLIEAQRTGRGRVVDVAMCDAVPVLLSLVQAFRQTGGWEDARTRNLLDGGAPFYRCYACRDGGFVAVGALEPQFYAALLHGLGLAPAYYPQYPREGWPKIQAAIASRFLTRDRDAWADHFTGIDACVSPVLTIGEATDAPHLKERRVFRQRDGIIEAAPAPRFGDPAALPPPATEVTPEELLARWRS
ncbi:MAG: CoA transferase [Chelatococcus sp.]|uniref:CaiB/BaiF CoA transferase family protein n=1 Tax=Chelatococcus sp. TaxID=1953771 RepID=UPI0025C2CD9F|nr:CaiB/BaiF CoA-transferase family protein [Chelatococcus sp.]MBX3538919.1 CoA transferase [Chelatococcus sp.]